MTQLKEKIDMLLEVLILTDMEVEKRKKDNLGRLSSLIELLSIEVVELLYQEEKGGENA